MESGITAARINIDEHRALVQNRSQHSCLVSVIKSVNFPFSFLFFLLTLLSKTFKRLDGICFDCIRVLHLVHSCWNSVSWNFHLKRGAAEFYIIS